jgi:hypothetical protein
LETCGGFWEYFRNERGMKNYLKTVAANCEQRPDTSNNNKWFIKNK